MGKAIIGVSSEFLNISLQFRESYKLNIVNDDYINLLRGKDVIPIILPIYKDLVKVKDFIDLCDGFLFTGGADINPLVYGENPNHNLGITDLDRDRFELELMKQAIEKDKSVLGICRGMQILNVSCKGNLIQDIKDKSNFFNHSVQISKGDLVHKILIKETSLLNKLYGKEIYVNSSHHQAINTLGDNLEVLARAEDGVIEAIKLKGKRFVYGVQWHPEELIYKDSSVNLLIDEFIKSCN